MSRYPEYEMRVFSFSLSSLGGGAAAGSSTGQPAAANMNMMSMHAMTPMSFNTAATAPNTGCSLLQGVGTPAAASAYMSMHAPSGVSPTSTFGFGTNATPQVARLTFLLLYLPCFIQSKHPSFKMGAPITSKSVSGIRFKSVSGITSKSVRGISSKRITSKSVSGITFKKCFGNNV